MKRSKSIAIFVDDGSLTGGLSRTNNRFYRIKLVNP